ncbi:MAG: hypothetical protein KC425_22315, partial [Anaerolineales bacterium]|nr:hypothetical protein [Anaerolineales bacterium]
QLALYAIGGDAIRGAVSAAETAGARGETAVLLNFPAWIAPQRATYALGQEGDILVLGPELLPPLVWAHGGPPVDVRAMRVDAIRQQPPAYFAGPLGDGAAWDAARPTALFHTVYLTDTIRLRPAAASGRGRLHAAGAANRPHLAAAGGRAGRRHRLRARAGRRRAAHRPGRQRPAGRRLPACAVAGGHGADRPARRGRGG